jgi:hypothetical protein
MRVNLVSHGAWCCGGLGLTSARSATPNAFGVRCSAWLGVAVIWLRCPVIRLFVAVGLDNELLCRK